MASIKKEYDSTGAVVYKVQASAGRGRRVKRSWRPEPGWSARTIERELNKFAAQLENELADGTINTRKENVEKARQDALEAQKLKTLRQYVESVYLPEKLITFSENTRSSYTGFFNNVIFPALGDFQMQGITTPMIKKVILDYQKSHAYASTVKLFNIFNSVFKMAYLDESIKENPMLRVPHPKQSKDEHPQDEQQQKAFTAQQLRYILQCLENEPLKWRCYVSLMADTGLRRGECGALQWQDVNWREQTIIIRRNIQYTPAAGTYIVNPKNGKQRTVDVGPDVIYLLQQLREAQARTAISQWVFTQNGSPDVMNPQTPTAYFAKFGKRYGIEGFHPHKLRHTSASLAITNGADVVSTSERLGHSDTTVTLRMYAHANEESIRRAGQTVRDALKTQEQ